MSNNTTSFGTLIDDLKASLRLARSNTLSFFLAHLGLAVLLIALLAIVAIPIAAVAISLGPAFWFEAGANVFSFAQANPLGIGAIAVLILIPVIAFLLVFVGAIFGMSKEVVETGETRAESAFSWFKNKFLPFFATGIILTLIILVPQVVVWGAVSIAMNYSVPILVTQVLSIFSFIYSFITLGFTLMVFPAVINGKGVQEAFLESFDLARKNFERVFGIHAAMVVFYLALFSPIIAFGLFAIAVTGIPPLILAGPLLGLVLYTVVALALSVLWFIPMTYITYVRVYNDLTGGTIAVPTIPDVPIV